VTQKKFVFHIREYNDCDHFSPIIWKLLSVGHEVIIVPYYNFNFHDDFRINYLLKNFRNLKILKLSKIYIHKSTRFFMIISKFDFNNILVKSLFRFLNWPFKIFEKSLFSKDTVLIWDWGNPGRLSHFEGLIYNLKTIVIPHGIDIFLERYLDEYPDFSDRNIYDTYILNSEKQKAFASQKLKMDLNKLKVMGCPRFTKEWILKSLSFTDEFIFGDENKQKVLYFVPHADHGPKNNLIERLIKEISYLPGISFVVKMSTRQKNILVPKSVSHLENLDHVHFDFDTPSTNLIYWSDIVINHGSSIVFDALQLGKTVIHANYLDELSSIFDDGDSTLFANDLGEVIKIIKALPHNAVEPKKIIEEQVFNNKDISPLDDYYNLLTS